jgi:hypothetical protein
LIVTFWLAGSCASAVPEEAADADELPADESAPVELAPGELAEDEHAAAARGRTTASAMPANRLGLFIHVLPME